MTDEEYADWQRDTHNAARQRIIDAYKEHLGRAPENDDVIEAYIANPGGLDDSVSAIAHSDEAVAKGEADFQAGFDPETGHSLPIPQAADGGGGGGEGGGEGGGGGVPGMGGGGAQSAAQAKQAHERAKAWLRDAKAGTGDWATAGARTGSDLAYFERIVNSGEAISWDRQLREGKGAGQYELSDLDGVMRNSGNIGDDPAVAIKAADARNVVQGLSGGDRAAGGYNTDLSDNPTIRARQQAQWGIEGQNMPAYARGTDRVDLPPTPPPGTPPPGGTNTLNNLLGGGNQGAPAGWPSGGAPAGAQPWGGFQSAVGPWGGGGPPVSPYMSASAWSPYQPAPPYIPPAPYSPGTYQPPTYTPAAPFTGPTAAQLTADPGYQFRLQQGQEALERSGAARGVTNTGGTLKNILDYGQQAASQEYGNVYNRMAGTYGMNEAARQAAFGLNAPQQFQGWAATEAGRLGAYQMAEADRAGAYGMNEANRAAAAQFNQGGYQQAYQNEAQRQQQDYANRYRQWSDQYNQWRQQGADRFDEQWMMAIA
jgi:hypothetical protein